MWLLRKLKTDSKIAQPRLPSNPPPGTSQAGSRREHQLEAARLRNGQLQSAYFENMGAASHLEDESPDGRCGMFVLVDQAADATGIVDIIAIHGLNGHYQKTWTATPKLARGKECNWLKDLLPKQIPNARIMSYGYNSIVQFSKSTARVGIFADALLEDIISWRRSAEEQARPIIFICHSLGGIVFKRVGGIPGLYVKVWVLTKLVEGVSSSTRTRPIYIPSQENQRRRFLRDSPPGFYYCDMGRFRRERFESRELGRKHQQTAHKGSQD
jgi:hypothetical protein